MRWTFGDNASFLVDGGRFRALTGGGGTTLTDGGRPRPHIVEAAEPAPARRWSSENGSTDGRLSRSPINSFK